MADSKRKNLVISLIILSSSLVVVVSVAIVLLILQAFKSSIHNELHCIENGGDCGVKYEIYEHIVYPKDELIAKNVEFSKNLGKYFAKLIINWNVNIAENNIEYPNFMDDGFRKVFNIWLRKLQNSPVFGTVLENEDCIVVLFRGTSTNKEWALNRKAFQKPFFPDIFPNVFIHKGFASFFEMVFPQMKSVMDYLEQKKKRVFFIGHSLGGVMAVLYSVYFAKLYSNNDCYCFNYGKPRIGDHEWKLLAENTLSNKIFRFANEDDVVTNIPLSVTLNIQNPKSPFLFCHEGKLIRVSENKKSLALNHSIYIILENLRKNKFTLTQ